MYLSKHPPQRQFLIVKAFSISITGKSLVDSSNIARIVDASIAGGSLATFFLYSIFPNKFPDQGSHSVIYSFDRSELSHPADLSTLRAYGCLSPGTIKSRLLVFTRSGCASLIKSVMPHRRIAVSISSLRTTRLLAIVSVNVQVKMQNLLHAACSTPSCP